MPLSDDELRALIGTCTNPTFRVNEPFHHRRDEAIIRLMMETGIRAGELVALTTDDLDLPAGRITPSGSAKAAEAGSSRSDSSRSGRSATTWTCASSTQLLRIRPSGSEPAAPASDTTASARRCARRAALAGIHGFHPHKLRHNAADRWLAAGGSESGLMAIAGWTRTDMRVRYTGATAAERAADEASAQPW